MIKRSTLGENILLAILLRLLLSVRRFCLTMFQILLTHGSISLGDNDSFIQRSLPVIPHYIL
jgi:hypothetical protein